MRAEHAPADREALQQPRVRPDPGHRRLDRDRQFLRADAQGRRDRARHAGAGRGRSLERAGERDHGRERRAATCGVEAARAASAQFAEAAAKLPVPENVPLKDPADFKLIGRDGAVHKLDSAGKTNGTAQFTIDIREPDMLTVVVAHPPRFGGKVASVDDAEARKVPGVVDVKQIPSGVAVYAQRHLAGAQGPRARCKITWDEVGSRKARQRAAASRSIARWRASPAWSPARMAMPKPRLQARRQGDRGGIRLSVSRACADGAARRLSALGRRDARSRASAASSRPSIRQTIARRARPHARARCRSRPCSPAAASAAARRPTSHFAAELAEVAKAIGPDRPVKLVWTREDDLRAATTGRCSCIACAARSRTARSSPGRTRIVGQSFLKGSPFEACMIKDGIDATSVEGSKELPYEIAELPLRPAHDRRRRADLVVAVGRPHPYRLRGRMLRRRTAARPRARIRSRAGSN